jgi:hypothetical protein
MEPRWEVRYTNKDGTVDQFDVEGLDRETAELRAERGMGAGDKLLTVRPRPFGACGGTGVNLTQQDAPECDPCNGTGLDCASQQEA